MGVTACPRESDPASTPGDSIEIRDWHDLHAVSENLGGSYVLMNDLAPSTVGYAHLAGAAANQGKGWQPIGTRAAPFTGAFDGRGYMISGLFIHRPQEDSVGLFGLIDERGSIENVRMEDAAVTGGRYVGSLVGYSYCGSVTNSYSTGSVSGGRKVGGLVGHNRLKSTVSNCWSGAAVTGDSYVGGLVGLNSGVVGESCAAGSVSGFWRVGGLVGQSHSTVSNSYAAGSVTGSESVGGLVGYLVGSTVANSYAVGTVSGSQRVGGLVGYVLEATVSNSYAAGSVAGQFDVGGLVGRSHVGTVSGSFWDREASGADVSDGGAGMTTAEMKDAELFRDAAWDIVAVDRGETDRGRTWNIVDGETYPFLSWQSVG